MPLLVGQGPDADVRVEVNNVYIGEVPESTMFLNKNDVTITSLTSTWQICNIEVCMINEVHEHDITMKSVGWTFDPSNGQLDAMGSQWYVKLVKITAVAANGDKFEYKDPVLTWTAVEAAPGPETMTEEEVKQLVTELTDSIATKKTEIDGMEEGTAEYNEAVAELDEMEADLAEACEYTTCVEKNAGNSDGASSESGLDLTVVLIVIGVIIAALLAGLMFMRGGNGGNGPERMVDWANELPANDAVANSMYGGAQEIFQQPVAAPAPAVAQVPPGAPPLPPGGLPAGWTMEQWAYYGHQYQQ